MSTGAFRRFSAPGKILTVLGDSGWSASGLFSGEVDAVLADPTGWVEHSGVTWTSVGSRT
ncbi:hypothetical protein MXD62_17765 [Frankia sp. Mgl5]|uniref:Uncharacterized protein n=1 Tax=Parafrankia soli TaxID=2599596 RepID=A0A1S1R1A4_9ACTN|nr:MULTISPECIES: hypothetical protein [Frankiaceae]MCK9929002.1 hypothetical protein [Frankia sp. Mgl5]OHV39717.1 hypothetical protein BBK14_13680 [Parafrankia soli]TCJ31663.1 hypothetical protein E0504_47255 [Parafrankia sp. BMG5.11]CAI7975492.1 hypothetical protein FRAHR75_190009 [Frankia sp. Hr75.2]